MTDQDKITALRDALFKLCADPDAKLMHFHRADISKVLDLTAEASEGATVGCDCGKSDWRDFYTGARVTDKICAECNTKHPIEWFSASHAMTATRSGK